MAAPAVGTVVDGYRFNGGDPRSQASWEPVRAAARPSRGGLPADDAKTIAEARNKAQTAIATASDAEEFLKLNREAGTGEAWGIPFASELRAAFDPKFAGMQSITNRMAPLQRVPGSGSSTDKDVGMFRRSIPNPDYTGPTNTMIAKRLESDAKRAAGYSAFMERWAQERGNLLGAQEAWTKYQASPRAAAPAPPRKAPAGAKPPVRVNTPEEAKALAPGTVFITPDGRTKVR
jgi:hypothetical protein